MERERHWTSDQLAQHLNESCPVCHAVPGDQCVRVVALAAGMAARYTRRYSHKLRNPTWRKLDNVGSQ